MYDFYNTTNPMLNGYMPEAYRDLTPEQQDEVATKTALYGCGTYALAFILGILLCALFGSCTPQRIVSDERTERVSQEVLQQMDSLLRIRSVAQQDSTWRQEILRQFQSIRERSDTSHTIVQDTAGNVVRETIIINNTRETTSETDRQELTVMSHRLEVMDSTVQAQSQMLQRMDSLLHEKQQTETKEVAKPLSGWQNFQLWLGRLLLIALALCAVVFVFRWWLKQKKVI